MANTTARSPRKKVDPNETPEEKFARLIEARGEKLLHQIKLFRNLTTSYAYKVDSNLLESWLNQLQPKYTELRTSIEVAITKGRAKHGPVEDTEEPAVSEKTL